MDRQPVGVIQASPATRCQGPKCRFRDDAIVARFCSAVLLILLALAVGSTPLATEQPLPDQQAFLQEVRRRLQPDDRRQSAYMFVVTERRVKVDSRGRAVSESTTKSESYPGFAPGEERWRRVIEENGRPVTETTLRKKDAERRREAEDYARRLQDRKERAKLDRERDRDRREATEAVDDIFRVYDVAMLGREAIDGHDTIVFSMAPRPRAVARTREGRWLRAFKGRAWVSETEHELVKLEVEAVDTISMGLGMLARMHKGTTAAFLRRKINGEAWLPARADYRFSARVLMLKSMRERGTVEFSDYRKFDVETVTTVKPPDVN